MPGQGLRRVDDRNRAKYCLKNRIECTHCQLDTFTVCVRFEQKGGTGGENIISGLLPLRFFIEQAQEAVVKDIVATAQAEQASRVLGGRASTQGVSRRGMASVRNSLAAPTGV